MIKVEFLLLSIKICDKELLLANPYYENSEKQELVTLIKRPEILNNIANIVNKNVIFEGNFNLLFDIAVETDGGNPILKKKSLAKSIDIKKTLDLCDIWGVWNPNPKFFKFHRSLQFRVSGRI